MTEEEAKIIVGPHAQAIKGFFKTAMRRYKEEYLTSARADHDASIQAQCINGHIISEASKYAAGFSDSEVRLSNVQNLKHLLIGGNVAIRFKKVDCELRPSNNETAQSLAYRCGGHVDGIQAEVHLDAGYRLNEAGDEIASVHLMRWSSPIRTQWHFEILDSEVKSDIIPLFDMPDKDDNELAEVKGKPSKVADIRKAENDD